MSGHSVEFCGFSRDDKAELSEKMGREIEARDVALVVWAEDLARVLLLAYDHNGKLIYRHEPMPTEEFALLDGAARNVARAMEILEREMAG